MLHPVNKNQLSIATICWARNEPEEIILRESLAQLAAWQIPVFVTDGGSSSHFLEFLRNFSHFTLLQAEGKGIWAQAKTSLLAAYEAGTSYIFYTEPDKLNFFRQHLAGILNTLPENDQIGIRLASRSEEAFTTFPPFQQMTETTINTCCGEITGQPLEYTYGPFLMRRELITYLKLLQEDIGWGWRPYIFCIAHRLGYQIESISGNFVCPPEQRKDDPTERIYRMRQLQQNIQGMVLSTQIQLK